jgi:hypothetical protein
MAAMAGATGARAWLQAQHATWLTERRMKVATVSIFAAAALGSTVGLKGATAPESDPPAKAPQHHTAPQALSPEAP